jgi:hypothetical protein
VALEATPIVSKGEARELRYKLRRGIRSLAAQLNRTVEFYEDRTIEIGEVAGDLADFQNQMATLNRLATQLKVTERFAGESE